MSFRTWAPAAALFSFSIINSVWGAPSVFYNAKVHPDFGSESADWIAVEAAKVTRVGKGKTFGEIKGANRIDLGGRFVFPGLTDAHLHLADIGEELAQMDLRNLPSADAAAARVKEFLESHPEEKTLFGNGWDQSDWPTQQFPDRKLLDRVSPRKPVVLYRIDGHAAWVNSAALAASGISDKTPDPKGGRLLRDRNGRLTGILIDTALSSLRPLRVKPSRAQYKNYIGAAVAQAVRHGMTGAHDAGASHEQIEAIRELLKEKRVRFRFYEMVSAKDPAELKRYLESGIETGAMDGQLDIRAVKLFADGAMGSRGAAFDEPYADDPSTRGLMRQSKTELEKEIRDIDKAGYQIAVHAIGSGANRLVAEAFETVLKKDIAKKRPRLEHAQVLTTELIQKIASLGIIASMQPTHCTSDCKWVVDRIGQARARFSYAWRSLLDAKAKLAFGSDAPIESLNPWPGVFSALTRTRPGGPPFFPEQAIDRLSALRAFSEGAAYAGFAEDRLGSLAPGKAADFFVSSRNPLTVSPEELKDFNVDETYVGGELVYRHTALN